MADRVERTPRPVTWERLRRAEEYALGRLAVAADKEIWGRIVDALQDRAAGMLLKEIWGRIVDALQDRAAGMLLGVEGDEPEPGWVCRCGNWEDSDDHCSWCGAPPPWGCSCGCHDDDHDEDDDESWMEDVP